MKKEVENAMERLRRHMTQLDVLVQCTFLKRTASPCIDNGKVTASELRKTL